MEVIVETSPVQPNNISAPRDINIIQFVEYSNIHADDVLLQRTHCRSFSNKHPTIPRGKSATARQRAAGG